MVFLSGDVGWGEAVVFGGLYIRSLLAEDSKDLMVALLRRN